MYVLVGFVFSTPNQWWAHPDPASAVYNIMSYNTCALAAHLLVVVGLCSYMRLRMRCSRCSLMYRCQCRYELPVDSTTDAAVPLCTTFVVVVVSFFLNQNPIPTHEKFIAVRKKSRILPKEWTCVSWTCEHVGTCRMQVGDVLPVSIYTSVIGTIAHNLWDMFWSCVRYDALSLSDSSSNTWSYVSYVVAVFWIHSFGRSPCFSFECRIKSIVSISSFILWWLN